MLPPKLLAFDFDGVLCDGLIEYFQTAWQAYCQLCPSAEAMPPAALASQFYRLRPVVESGWEMPLLLRSLLAGVPEAKIVADWPAIALQAAADTQHSVAEIAALVDGVRDRWIAADLDNWLAQHRFYPGVTECLQQALQQDIYVVIISTKEGRFVKQLLQQRAIDLPESQIFGKEVKQPKTQTLRVLRQQLDPSQPIDTWFLEDRLKTLQVVSTQPDLADVQLFLADWGYNTPADRELAQTDARIHLLSPAHLTQPLVSWLSDSPTA